MKLSESERQNKKYFFEENNLFKKFYNNDLDEDKKY